MRVSQTNNIHFGAKIRLMPEISSPILKAGGSSSVGTGISVISSGLASGADVIVHCSDSAVPFMQKCFSLFEHFANAGHKMMDLFVKWKYKHNGYDASFFSTTMSSLGSASYAQGMNYIVKGINKSYHSKMPT